MSAARQRLPELAALVLCLLLPRASRVSAIGDLSEDFEALGATTSTLGRTSWFVRQSLSLVLGYWLRRASAPLARETFARAGGSGSTPGRGMPGRGGGLFGDLLIAVRGLRRAPGYAAIIVATLAIGIGLNIATFAVINAALFVPLPFDATIAIHSDDASPMIPASASIGVWRANARLLERVEGTAAEQVTWTGGDEPRLLEATYVTPDLPRSLGVTPALGRLFGADEGEPTGEPVVLLTEALWRREFGARTDVVGRRMTLADVPRTIVGVLPMSFSLLVAAGDVVVPHTFTYDLDRLRSARIFAWLADGATFEAAQAELRGLTLEENRFWGYARLFRPREGVRDQIVPQLLFVLGLVSLVLLIACANVANLMAARGTRRRRELAVRAALGAGRWRLLRELLAESLVLSLLAGAVGVVAWSRAVRVLARFAAGSAAGLSQYVGVLSLDGRVLLWAAGVSLLTALVSASWPALAASRLDLAVALKSAGTPATAGRRQRFVRSALVALQVTISLALLFGAGLLTNSLLRLQAVEPGFDAERLLTLHVRLPRERYAEAPQRTEFFARLLERIERLDGAEAATFVNIAPPFPGVSGSLEVDNRPGESIRFVGLQAFVEPGFFRALQIPLLRGDLDRAPTDPSLQHVVINEGFARSTWPDQDPIGRRIHLGGGWMVVDGVVADIHQVSHNLTVAGLQMYHLMEDPRGGATLIVRVAGEPAAMVRPIKEQVWALDPRLPVDAVETLEERLAASRSIDGPRSGARMLGAFSLLALVLACVGIVGVVSTVVGERTREIGIRMALGADAAGMRKMIVSQALVPVVVGAVVGTAAAMGIGRLLRSSLYGVGVADLPTLLATAGVLIAAALAASWLPARRATRVDPRETLRAE